MFKEIFIVLILLFLLSSCANEEQIGLNDKNLNDNQMATSKEVQIMKITSPEFIDQGKIPSKYTCDGIGSNPPLNIADVPEGAISLVLIMDDPDIPLEVKKARGIEVFDHWIIFNISPKTKNIAEGQKIGLHGKNSRGDNNYTGPCPPQQYKPKEHRYFFKLYALDVMLDLDEGASKAEVEQAMEGHIVKKAELVGRYERSK